MIGVTAEKWQWVAIYNDGTSLKQFDDAGFFHQFKEIDQSKLFVFRMVSGSFMYSLIFDPVIMKLIHFYQNTTLNMGTDIESKIKVYCFGYEMNIGGKTYKHISAIMPDNNLVMTGDMNKIQIM
jgi:hypothetical protein